jgi:RNA polymerase sigma-70 factor (ECF subfamily)
MGLGVELPAIGRLRAQDGAAFGLLVDAHYGRVQRYLARLLGDAETAADLTQETFLRAYAALPRLADDSDLAGWLFRIAINLARQHHRRHRLVCWARLPRGEADPVHPRLLEDDVLQQDQIRHALDRLSLDQRSCLLLYAWTGYTCAEIGEIVGRSPDAVRMLLVRARRRFRSAYAAYRDGLDSIDRDHGSDGEAYGSGDAGRTGRGGAPPSVTGRGGNRTAGAAGTAAVAGPGGSAGHMDDERDADARCEAVQEVLPFYPRGDLPRDSFHTVTRHLTHCLRCRSALADTQGTYRVLQRHLNTAGDADPRWAPAAALVRRRMGIAAVAVPAAAPETAEAAAASGGAPASLPVLRARSEPPPVPLPPWLRPDRTA